MTIWSLITLLCDCFKLESLAAWFWQKHKAVEIKNAETAIDRQPDSYIIAKLRSQYQRD